ncbi:MAG: GMC family oxidoreductase [Vicinamibacterales bacterium]
MSRQQPGDFDVIVVGSGCGGSMSVHRLVHSGARVLNLEYGPEYTEEDLGSFEQYYDAYPRLGYAPLKRALERPGPGSWKRAPYFEFADEMPYETAGEGWYWRRYRGVGGRSMFWAGVAPRMSELDFREPEVDGFGPTWPLTYDELKPHYDWIDAKLGRVGPTENHPNVPAGLPQPPQGLRCGERIIQATCERLKGEFPLLRYTHSPKMIATRPMGAGRAPCHYLGNCMEGCRNAAKFQAKYHVYPAAQATGLLTLRPNSVVLEVLVDPASGRAAGVRYVDRVTKQDYEARAPIVVVAASTLDTPRILLNSRSARFPNGVGNGSGHVGRHLNDHIQCSVIGYLPQLYGHRTYNDDGYTFGVMIPRFTNSYQQKAGFIRGWEGRSGSGKGVNAGLPGFGKGLKDGIRERYQARISLLGFGAKVDNPGTFVEPDPSGRKDEYGMPLAKIHSAYADNDLKIFADMREKFTYILEQAGAESIRPSAAPSQPGTSEHEVGTCRMTRDAKDGVCDRFGRVHEVANLFVADGSVFTQQTDKSPTLTIMALALRQADFIAQQWKRKEL